MAKLIYISNVSLDGYIEDEHGNFDWSAPDDEVFAFITDLVRSVGTHLYGRRLYGTMAVWENDPALAAQSELMGDFANVWQAADKVVYSTTPGRCTYRQDPATPLQRISGMTASLRDQMPRTTCVPEGGLEPPRAPTGPCTWWDFGSARHLVRASRSRLERLVW